MIVCKGVPGRQRVAILSPKNSCLWHFLLAFSFVELKFLKNGKRLYFFLAMTILPQVNLDQLMWITRCFGLDHACPVIPRGLPSRPQLGQSLLEILVSLFSRTYLNSNVLILSVKIFFILRKSGDLQRFMRNLLAACWTIRKDGGALFLSLGLQMTVVKLLLD